MKSLIQIICTYLLVALCMGASLHGQTNPPASMAGATTPLQSFPVSITPPLIDFGAIKPGSRQKGEFKIKNNGTTAVKIESAFPSCKCTTLSDLAGKEIMPGAELVLSASLDAPRTPGEKDAKVFVTIAGSPQPLVAKMQGVVQLPLLVTPSFIDALKGKTRGVVEISNPTKKPFHILSCDGQSPQFVDFDPSKDAARDTYRVRWDFSLVPDGRLQQWWCVETDVQDCPIIPLRIRHETTGIRFDPKADERRWFIPEAIAIAGKIAMNKSVELEIEFESSVSKGKPQPLGWDMVRGVQPLDPAFAAELISSKREGDRVRVQFRFTALKPNSQFIYAPLAIQTDTGSGRFFVAAVVSP